MLASSTPRAVRASLTRSSAAARAAPPARARACAVRASAMASPKVEVSRRGAFQLHQCIAQHPTALAAGPAAPRACATARAHRCSRCCQRAAAQRAASRPLGTFWRPLRSPHPPTGLHHHRRRPCRPGARSDGPRHRCEPLGSPAPRRCVACCLELRCACCACLRLV